MDKNQDFYFMEMNTRLQVEHPVSEMVTGVDLVEWQLRIARGEKIPIAQPDIPLMGHSVEARVYAEDPENGFLPGAGKLVYLSQPPASDDVRVETGVRQGDDVSQYYDPMIAKLVVWGHSREEALDRLSQRLSQYHVVGLPTNIQFLKRVAQSDEFQNAELDTGFIERHEHKLIPKTMAPTLETVVGAAMVRAFKQPVASIDPFDLLTNFRVNPTAQEVVDLNALGETYSTKLTTLGENHFQAELNGETFDGRISKNGNGFVVEVNGVKTPATYFTNGQEFYFFAESGPVLFEIPVPKYMAMTGGGAGADDAIAPMTGTVTQVLVQPGQEVAAGDLLMTMVAMKMEHAIKAPKDGVIKSVLATEGETVDRKALLVRYAE